MGEDETFRMLPRLWPIVLAVVILALAINYFR